MGHIRRVLGRAGTIVKVLWVLLRPDGGCQKMDATFTKGAMDGQFSNTGEAADGWARLAGMRISGGLCWEGVSYMGQLEPRCPGWEG